MISQVNAFLIIIRFVCGVYLCELWGFGNGASYVISHLIRHKQRAAQAHPFPNGFRFSIFIFGEVGGWGFGTATI